MELWHRRLGHPALKVVAGLKDLEFSSSNVLNSACEICNRAKQTRCYFPLSNNKTWEIFEMVHCDIWGPYRIPSHSGARYFLTIVDDYSRGTWVYLMNMKSETPTKLRYFLAMINRQFGKLVRTIGSDNGSEFLSMTTYFLEQGIHHETSCVGTPQQNASVE
ncbi:Retrovirus-related Pol polyprotein from transposon TNT 1-94 [Cardamine amara subsp. amara]|uniref:Retrovirus-related Pol polyprotein from transposon TNT 1-94 n=1 Tax=Cardamine amara subsp. amara TaxID=228776 RepID=A0ABD1BFH6_CARAN